MSLEMVKKLRAITGAGILDCKKALNEVSGDLDKAIELLRVRLGVKAGKRIGSDVCEGFIFSAVSENKSSAFLIKISCETDFAARSKDFSDFGKIVSKAGLENCVTSIDDLCDLVVDDCSGDKASIDDLLLRLKGKLREEVVISDVAYISSEDGVVGCYVHNGRLGSLVAINKKDNELANDIAMHIVASSPLAINKEQLSHEEPKNLFVARFIGKVNVFKCKIISATDDKVKVEISGSHLTLRNNGNFKKNDIVDILVRPEDLKVWGRGEIKYEEDMLFAKVQEVIYKGSTVDLIVKLNNGQLLSASEFFDEDDENLEYEIGEPVLVRWMTGWEVILPHEK